MVKRNVLRFPQRPHSHRVKQPSENRKPRAEIAGNREPSRNRRAFVRRPPLVGTGRVDVIPEMQQLPLENHGLLGFFYKLKHRSVVMKRAQKNILAPV